jgi:protease-4
MNGRNWFSAVFGGLWRVLGKLARAVKVLIIVMFLLFLVTSLFGGRIQVPESAALIVDPAGILVDQFEGDPLERALAELQDSSTDQTRVKDVVDSLRAAQDDERIQAVVLRLGALQGGGLSKLQEVGTAIDEIRAAGKTVIAMGDGYTQAQYYLASRADEIYMHDFGFVLIEGFGHYKAYLRAALEKLQIDVNVFRVGEYKSFVEPYLRDDMSEEDKIASRRWLTALWGAYQADVVGARGLQPGALDTYANSTVELVAATEGDTAQAALNAGLVDELLGHQEFRARMIEQVGESDDSNGTYASIGFRSYLSAVGPITDESAVNNDNVAVLMATGMIVDGDASPGTIGGQTLSGLVQRATEDDSIAAVVLRVDSPGGSMFASEVIYDELEVLKAAGKPFVVSMGSVAASGGYYISMLADEIWANATTLSGSIGVGALFPTFQRGLSSLGINVDGIGTTNLTGQFSPLRELGVDIRQLIQLSTEDAYWVFVNKVAADRNLSPARVDEIAQGRVWIGTDALELGLIDQIGGLQDAIDAAASLAGLESGKFGVQFLDQELDLLERIVVRMAGFAGNAAARLGITMGGGSPGPMDKLVRLIEQELSELMLWNDPRGLYYHCLCGSW